LYRLCISPLEKLEGIPADGAKLQTGSLIRNGCTST